MDELREQIARSYGINGKPLKKVQMAEKNELTGHKRNHFWPRIASQPFIAFNSTENWKIVEN